MSRNTVTNTDQVEALAVLILGFIAAFIVVPGMLYFDYRAGESRKADLRTAIERTDAETVVSRRNWGRGSGQLMYQTCAKVDGERDCFYGSVEVPESVYVSHAVGDVIAREDMHPQDVRELRG